VPVQRRGEQPHAEGASKAGHESAGMHRVAGAANFRSTLPHLLHLSGHGEIRYFRAIARQRVAAKSGTSG